MKALVKNNETGNVFCIHAKIDKWGRWVWVTGYGVTIGPVGFPLLGYEVLKIYYRRPE